MWAFSFHSTLSVHGFEFALFLCEVDFVVAVVEIFLFIFSTFALASSLIHKGSDVCHELMKYHTP